MLLILLAVGLALAYLYHVNRGLTAVPEEARRLSPNRWTKEEIQTTYQKNIDYPVDSNSFLPPKQGRRYIVVGGTGLVGNWVVSHLLARGEDPTAIRVLDLQSPRQDILDQGVTYIKTNIADEASVSAAFSQQWPHLVAHFSLTVFHNAAVIRPAERLKEFLHLCSDVNVNGTKYVLNAAKKSGATCFISTSSGSVCIRNPSFWIAPWARLPDYLVQVISDETDVPKEHDHFFGNYAVSKAEAEKIVRDADDAQSNFRTGCIRPANGIYGIGGDKSASTIGYYLRIRGCLSWTPDFLQSFVNAENVSLAHLLYEQRLLDLSNPIGPKNLPDIGGDAFVVTDPNQAPSFSDIYLLLITLAKTPVNFTIVPAIPLYLLSYLVEWYTVLQHRYFSTLPKVTGDLAQMQPAQFSISDVHAFADDSRARKAPEAGGLGYEPFITTLDGMCREVAEWNSRV